MQLLNATRMQAGYTMGMDPSGREFLVVAVKGTFHIPHDGSAAGRLTEEQVALIDSDVFTGEPGFSAPLYEYDYPPVKPKCDVLLNGSAYAPRGRSTSRVHVSLHVGEMVKGFDVVGHRSWVGALLAVAAGPPQPFVKMPISYDCAFGGIDSVHPDPARHRYYELNHAGVGFHSETAREFIDGAPLPNTEEPGRPVIDPRGRYRPMAFGPIARAWQPRVKFAGTYDQHWLDEIFPFLPPDFDERYYQAAPPDQQIEYPHGGERVVLENLTPAGRLEFNLPTLRVPVVFYLRDGDPVEKEAVIDTLVLEPDLGRFTMTWRASLPLRRNMFEVDQVLAGEMPRSWHRARELGKTYYPSLGAMVAAKKEDMD
jgi:hypothetical protein